MESTDTPMLRAITRACNPRDDYEVLAKLSEQFDELCSETDGTSIPPEYLSAGPGCCRRSSPSAWQLMEPLVSMGIACAVVVLNRRVLPARSTAFYVVADPAPGRLALADIEPGLGGLGVDAPR
jgi:hypothetical protein